jgi:N6-adenosine-specific RNA methylase IME4
LEIEIHKLCEIFPMMSPGEFAALKEDIEAHGLLTPITLCKGAVIDGRNRLQVCQELGVEPRFQEWSGDDLLAFILSANLQRRHLNESQRGMVFAKIANLPAHRPAKDKSANLPTSTITQPEAAKLLNVSERTGRDAKVILSSAPDLAQKIEAGEMTVCQAKRKLSIQAQIESISRLKPIEGLFDTIVIDPPWPYGGEYDEQGHRGTSPYPEMPIEQLRLLKLPVAQNCILWLWTTHKFIWKAKELLTLWGFDYKGILVWDKQKMGMGNWLRMQCEFCLLGIKGKPVWQPKSLRDIISAPRTAHSEKPEAFYDMVNQNFSGAKLDYFSRKKRKGWICYGAESL